MFEDQKESLLSPNLALSVLKIMLCIQYQLKISLFLEEQGIWPYFLKSLVAEFS